jgi:hypothetical protein
LFGCKTKQVKELLIDKLSAGTLTPDQKLDVYIKLALILTPNTTWEDDVDNSNAPDRWNMVVAGVNSQKQRMCQNCCCQNVFLTFNCQNDKDINDDVKLIMKYWKIKNFSQLPEGDTFCGKTFRWNCAGNYGWELWPYGVSEEYF